MKKEVAEVLQRVKDEKKLRELLDVVAAVKAEYLKVGWGDDGKVDEEMYKRMWIASKDLLSWEITWDLHVEVFQVLEDMLRIEEDV